MQVDFHIDVPDKLRYACRVVRKIYRSGICVVVVSDCSDLLQEFDSLLWTFSEQDFIPHLFAQENLAAQTPVVLCETSILEGFVHKGRVSFCTNFHNRFIEKENLVNQCISDSKNIFEVLINLGNTLPPSMSYPERFIEIVTSQECEKKQARMKWRFYQKMGYALRKHFYLK